MQINITRDLAHMLSEALSQYIDNTVGDANAEPLTTDQTYNVLLQRDCAAGATKNDRLIAGAAHMKTLIAYYRVSTQKQGRSGLGLEAQRSAVQAYAKANDLVIAAEYTEVETGKGADALDRRPQLAAALAAAKKAKTAIVIAKLDRLTRDVAFGATLMVKKVPFIDVQYPHADQQDASPPRQHIT